MVNSCSLPYDLCGEYNFVEKSSNFGRIISYKPRYVINLVSQFRQFIDILRLVGGFPPKFTISIKPTYRFFFFVRTENNPSLLVKLRLMFD